MHHERMDGTGYHRGVTAAAIPIGARVLAAADVFQALTEPRPHRSARSSEEAAQEIEAMVAAGTLDTEASRAVCDAARASLRRGRVSAPWPAGLTDREVEVLRLLARGLTKKEIAKELVIAPGTAHTHTVHIYEKLGPLDKGRRRLVRAGARPRPALDASNVGYRRSTARPSVVGDHEWRTP
jgi:DNA-binding CsgD family transcriptional regulator